MKRNFLTYIFVSAYTSNFGIIMNKELDDVKLKHPNDELEFEFGELKIRESTGNVVQYVVVYAIK